jgi:NAD(P)-dependent dehydrogenase (short-subunit alcohol dehydrogenase family)
LFPSIAQRFLEEGDDIDAVLRNEERAANEYSDDEEEADMDELEDDLLEDVGPGSPESEWALAKFDHSAVSPSMDKLMALTGLKSIKVVWKQCDL